jgi:hypothetical protein
MGTPPAECFVVEDAPAGVQAAKNAGTLAQVTTYTVLDTSVWGLGIAVGVLQFKPKVATQRLLQHECAQHHREGWVPGVGMRPRLWRNPLGAEAIGDGLQAMEAALKRSFAEMQQGGAPGSTQSIVVTVFFAGTV